MSGPSLQHGLEIKFGTIYGEEEERAILATLKKGAPTSGDACIQFEKDFAAYEGTTHARTVTNGTAALFLAMVALDAKPGDRVITTPLTWIATAAAPATLGANVEFVDVDPETGNLDPAALRKRLAEPGAPVKAVLPVHLYGRCCDMDGIMALAAEHGFAVVEDACHAIGAEYKGRKAGSIGALGCFSFHEQKNISTLGEGGMVVTSDAALFERVALYRSHCTRVYGASTKYCSFGPDAEPMGKRFWWQDFDDTGYNFRLTDMQAAVGIEQLKKLDGLNAKRRENALKLADGLAGIPGLKLPEIPPGREHVFHLFPIQLDPAAFGMGKIDFIYRMMHEKGIKCGAHYNPLNWSTAFKKRGMGRGMFPVAEMLAERVVTLPVAPSLSGEALDYLIASIRSLAK